jgi:hypothetical protein
MSSCSLSYLGGVFDRAATILCGSDAVIDPVTGQIITPLPHNIVQLLTSPHLNCNHSICCCCCCCFVVVVVLLLLSLSSFCHRCPCCCCYHPFLLFCFISTLGNAVYSLPLCVYCCVHWERGLPILVCFGSHYKYSGRCKVLPDILGWRMAR